MFPQPSLDDLRVARPDLSLAIYAFIPGGEVTLEIHSDGQVYTFKGATEADAILAAFPPAPEPMQWQCPRCHLHYDSPNHECPAMPDSVFD